MNSALFFLAIVLLLGFCLLDVDAHGMMSDPAARNVVAFARDEPGPVQYCPHCLNTDTRRTTLMRYPETLSSAEGHGLCGDKKRTDDSASCWNGGDCPEHDHMPGGKFYTAGEGLGGQIVKTYTSGEEILVEFFITAHHRGVIELRLCDEARVTEACLQKYPPLERVRYESDTLIQKQPINPEYPSFFYINPVCSTSKTREPIRGYEGYSMKGLFKLPDGVACEQCVLQMWWMTANSCIPPGYIGFPFPSEYENCPGDGGDGWYSPYFDECEGTDYGEEFWNCADIRITGSGGGVSTPVQQPSPNPPPPPPPPPPSPPPPPPPSPALPIQSPPDDAQNEDLCTYTLNSTWNGGFATALTGPRNSQITLVYETATTIVDLPDVWNAVQRKDLYEADGKVVIELDTTWTSFGFVANRPGTDSSLLGMYIGSTCCLSECRGGIPALPLPDTSQCTYTLNSTWNGGFATALTGPSNSQITLVYETATSIVDLPDVWNAVERKLYEADGKVVIQLDTTWTSFGFVANRPGTDSSLLGMYIGSTCCLSECRGGIPPPAAASPLPLPSLPPAPPPCEESEWSAWNTQDCNCGRRKLLEGNTRVSPRVPLNDREEELSIPRIVSRSSLRAAEVESIAPNDATLASRSSLMGSSSPVDTSRLLTREEVAFRVVGESQYEYCTENSSIPKKTRTRRMIVQDEGIESCTVMLEARDCFCG